MNQKILITGGAGFVGSNLTEKLIKKGYDVKIIDNFSKGNIDYIQNLDCHVIDGDIRNPDSCREAFKGIDKVVHLAAFGSVVDSVADPIINFDMNVLGTFNVLNIAKDENISRIIFSSTGGALIGNATPPVSEKSLPKPISPYGASKLCCEAYLNAFHHSYGIETIALRFANVYGKKSLHKVGVINKFSQNIVQNKPLTVYGDGSSTRDYIHVDDLCSGITLALEHEQLKNEVIHLATGRETSIKELADILLEVSGAKNKTINYLPQRPGEVERNFALYNYAEKTINYKPKVNLEEGLKTTFEYLSQFYQDN